MRKLGDSLLAMVASVTLAVAASISPVGPPETPIEGDPPTKILWVVYILAVAARIPIGALAFTAAFRVTSKRTLPLRSAFIGGVLVIIAVEILLLTFTQITVLVTRYSAVYGVLGSIMAGLTFVYLSAQALLFGAELASSHDRYTNNKPIRSKRSF